MGNLSEVGRIEGLCHSDTVTSVSASVTSVSGGWDAEALVRCARLRVVAVVAAFMLSSFAGSSSPRQGSNKVQQVPTCRD